MGRMNNTAVCACPCLDIGHVLQELSFDYQWEAHHLRENTKCLCGTPQCR